MRRLIRSLSVVVITFLGLSSLVAQNADQDFDSKVSKRENRKLAKFEKKEAYEERVKANVEEFLLRFEQKDLVIMGDGKLSSRMFEPTISDFFRIMGDTLTFQKMEYPSKSNKLGAYQGTIKKKGLITGFKVWEYQKGKPRRISFGYTDFLTSEYFKMSIFIHANRFELYDDFMLKKLLRGRLTSNEAAGFLERGGNSAKLLLKGRPRSQY